MTPDQAVAFALFSLVMAGTPGPSNALLTATGGQVGVFRGAPAVLGVAAGMAALMFTVTLGLGALLTATPLLLTVLRLLGAAFLLYLAYGLARSSHATSTAAMRPVGFVGAALFQLVNPKSWLACASAAAAFAAPSDPAPLHASVLTLIFVAVAIPACASWLAFGALIQRTLRSLRAQRAFNLTMAALLAASVVLLFVA